MWGLPNLLRYLDRGDIAEIVVSPGRVITALVNGEKKALTQVPVPPEQIAALVASAELAPFVPAPGAKGEKHPLGAGGHKYLVAITHHGNSFIVWLGRDAPPVAKVSPTPAPVPAPVPAPAEEPHWTVATPDPVRLPTPAPVRTAAPPPSVRSAAPAAARTPAMAATGIDPDLCAILAAARRQAASDVHIVAGRPPLVRKVGLLEPTGEALSPERVRDMLLSFLSAPQVESLASVGYTDLALDVAGAGRLRINVNQQKTGLKGCFRLIATIPPTLESLGLPPELAKVATYHQGLAIVSGPNGHGKTTTMAALIDLINSTKRCHIITVEDPIEIVHPRKLAVMSQRQVGTHTDSFRAALKASLREDPDVIAIGELRDLETVEMALSAAETGHLVIATMSAPSGAKTIDRLIDMFPSETQSQVRATLAGALKIVVSQRLLPRADGKGMAAAAEIITGNVPLWSLIRDNKLFQLPSLLQRGRAFGMMRLEDSLRELINAHVITQEAAISVLDDPKALKPPAVEPTPEPTLDKSGGLRGLFKQGE